MNTAIPHRRAPWRDLGRGVIAPVALRNLSATVRAQRFAQQFHSALIHYGTCRVSRADNPLLAYFDAHATGPGIWKWRHYFDIYHRHLERWRGKAPVVVEIGVYSGGSLGMWHDYFGDGTHIYGVDIQPECRRYADPLHHIYVDIGDASDPQFWHDWINAGHRLDVVIDDGSHEYRDQRVALECLLPHLSPGGIYLCEDIQGTDNGFAAYCAGLVQALHAIDCDPGQIDYTRTSGFQRTVASIHHYPFVTVIERALGHAQYFLSEQRGDQWETFLPWDRHEEPT